MNIRTKSQIVGKFSTQITLINEFVKAIEIIKKSDIVKSHDGKKITKRFTDKLQALLPNYIVVSIASESWTHFLSLTLYFDKNKYNDNEIKKFLTYNESECIINQKEANKYEPLDLTYCVNGVREFHTDKFWQCAERKIILLNNEKTQYELALNRLDEVIKKTKELETLVRGTISDFPPYIKPMVTFDYTITDD